MDNLLFCDIIPDFPFLISYILIVGIWIGAAVFIFSKVNEKAGIFYSVCVAICYIFSTVNEFKEGDILHGIIALLPVILLIAVAIYGAKQYAKEEKIREKEIPLIPERAEGFIAAHGYASPEKFIRYSNEAPEFQNARSVQYTNPLYTKQVNENEQRKKNNQEPIKITEPKWISYGNFAEVLY